MDHILFGPRKLKKPLSFKFAGRKESDMKFFISLLMCVCGMNAFAGQPDNTWMLPKDGDYAKEAMITQFSVPWRNVCYFEIDGVPVHRAMIGWRTYENGRYYGILHTRVYDFSTKTLIRQSDL